MLERLHGLARDVYYRSAADDRFSDRAITNKVRPCLGTLPSHSGFSAYRPASGADPVELYAAGRFGLCPERLDFGEFCRTVEATGDGTWSDAEGDREK